MFRPCRLRSFQPLLLQTRAQVTLDLLKGWRRISHADEDQSLEHTHVHTVQAEPGLIEVILKQPRVLQRSILLINPLIVWAD